MFSLPQAEIVDGPYVSFQGDLEVLHRMLRFEPGLICGERAVTVAVSSPLNRTILLRDLVVDGMSKIQNELVARKNARCFSIFIGDPKAMKEKRSEGFVRHRTELASPLSQYQGTRREAWR